VTNKVERAEKARESVRVFRTMLPALNGYVRALTGNKRLRIEISATSNGGTDGRTIQYRPPIELGERIPHDRSACDRRDEHGQQRCRACRRSEHILATIYHEIAHNAYDSFAPVDPKDAADFTQRAADLHGSKYGKAIAARLNAMPDRQRRTYPLLAQFLSEYLPLIFNSLEDARVNARMFDARKGTRAIFEAQIKDTFERGIENPDGEREHWRDRPLNSQAIIGMFLKASRYDFSGWLLEKVENDLNDPVLTEICDKVVDARGPGDIYTLAFNTLARLRELGYCKSERDPEVEDEEDEQSEPEEPGDAGESTDPSDVPDAADDSDGSGEEGGAEGEDVPDDQPVPAPAADDAAEGTEPADEGADGDDAGDGDSADPGESGPGAGDDEPGDPDDSPEGEDPAEGEGGEPEGAPDGSDPDSGTEAGSSNDPAPDEADAGSEGDGDDGNGSSPSAGDDLGDSAESEGGANAGNSSGDGDGARGEGGDGPEAGDEGGDGGVPDEESATEDVSSGSESGESSASDEQPEGVDSDGEEGSGSGSPDAEGEEGADRSEGSGSLGTGSDTPDSSVADDADSVDGDGADDTGEGQSDEGGVSEDGDSGGEAGDSSPEGDSSLPHDSEAGDGNAGGSLPGEVQDSDASTDGSDGPDEVGDDGDPATHDLGGESDEEPVEYDYGNPSEVARDVRQGMHHDENDQVARPDHTPHTLTPREFEDKSKDEEAIATAVVQGKYFDTSSAYIGGVREHTPDNINRPNRQVCTAWDNRHMTGPSAERVGVGGDFDPPESILGPALLRMRVAFSNNRRAHDTLHLKSGKINGRALGKRAWGDDERLFKRKSRPGKRDYSVVIGMDVSGSTAGQELAMEKRAVMAQAEMLNRIGVRFAVVAHSANYSGVPEDRSLWMDIYHVKDFDQPWNDQTRTNLRGLGPDGGNLDGHTLEFYRKMLDRETTTDRIIMYYTDGEMPASNYEEELEILQRELRGCAQKGYTVMGVGIGTDSPTQHGLETVVVNEDSDIPAVVRFLEKRLERTVR